MTPTKDPGLQRLGDVEDAATMLNMSVKTIRRMIDKRQIPGVIRLSRLIRIDLSVVSRWIDQGCPPLHKFVTESAA